MSYIVKSQNGYKTLSDFLVNESIIPVKTDFGTNENRNNKMFHYFDNFVVSYFTMDNIYYVVGLDTNNGDVGFGVSDENTFDPNQYSDSKFITSNPVAVFGKVFYVLTKIIRETNTDTVMFDSANYALGKIYDKLVKNEYFLKSLNDLGFEYIGKIEEKYVFKKVE